MTRDARRTTKQIALADIRIDGGTQSRASLNQQTIEDYADEMRDGVQFPPIVVFYDGKEYWLADGFHRWYATRKADLEKIACEVKQGTRRDAVLYSVGTNGEHGLRRTNADKRRAVELLLSDKEWGKRSDRWIAEKCGVGHPFVGDVRGQLESDSSCHTRQGQDGRARRQPAKPEPEPEPEPEDNGIVAVADADEWEPPEPAVEDEPESDEAPVTPIPTTHRRPRTEIPLSDFGKVADSIEAQIGLLLQECGEYTPEDRKAFNFSEGVKKLRFAEMILSEAKVLL